MAGDPRPLIMESAVAAGFVAVAVAAAVAAMAGALVVLQQLARLAPAMLEHLPLVRMLEVRKGSSLALSRCVGQAM